MSNLLNYAEHELSLIEIEPDDNIQEHVNKCILDIVRIFADQGHSGTSAPYVIKILEKLLRFEPLTPLTGEDSEWVEIYENGPLQNKRCPRVFKDKENGAYDIQGRVFIDKDGCSYTSIDSRVYIEFPYTPTIEYVKES